MRVGPWPEQAPLRSSSSAGTPVRRVLTGGLVVMRLNRYALNISRHKTFLHCRNLAYLEAIPIQFKDQHQHSTIHHTHFILRLNQDKPITSTNMTLSSYRKESVCVGTR